MSLRSISPLNGPLHEVEGPEGGIAEVAVDDGFAVDLLDCYIALQDLRRTF